MTGFIRNPEMIWVRPPFPAIFPPLPPHQLGHDWVHEEPKADLGSSQTQVYSALGSTQTQSRSRFVANPSLLCSGFDANLGLLWVCREPKFALGSARTQISSRKMYANSLIHGDSHMRFAEDRNKRMKKAFLVHDEPITGFATNPDHLWVLHEPNHAQEGDEGKGEEKQ
ncbi:hypothetical protein SLEP1_g12416 [Rubroshorea leprosula]|uniref:Uncharacterized protein n=1 Tax=Rubroshorea leprosula TaxID=152421 RepID=A0AAV5IMK7_9ROSI|nr:hypothetical protein SLEP1_g12416 [Rubroshorea leprosula]